jgi:hypothetical protein
MKDYSVIKKRICELDSAVGESVLDASGPTTEEVDYNFDLLRKKYDGTDFEREAHCMCDLMGMFSTGCKSAFPTVLGKISEMLHSDIMGDTDENLAKYVRFVEDAQALLDEVHSHHSIVKAIPSDVDTAQAKLMELENYIKTTGLQREKWNRYLDNARKMAMVGDSSFDAAPELGQDDMEYIRERDRKQQKKQQLMNSLVTA